MFRFHRLLAAWNLPGLVYADFFVSLNEPHAVVSRLKDIVGRDPRLSLEVVDSEFILRLHHRRRRSLRSAFAGGRLAADGDGTRVYVRVVEEGWLSLPLMLPVAAFLSRPAAVILLAVLAFLYVLAVLSTRSEGRYIAGFVRSAAHPIRR